MGGIAPRLASVVEGELPQQVHGGREVLAVRCDSAQYRADGVRQEALGGCDVCRLLTMAGDGVLHTPLHEF